MNKSKTAILVIDDEPQIRRFLRAGFELEGFTVREAENATVGLKSATLNQPDLIVLDLGLPDLDGAEVLERIRAWSSVPIIVLSVEADEMQKVRLLRMGADDYVVKPFGMAELLARTDAALRRYFRGVTKDSIVRAGDLSIDLVTRVVTVGGARVQLTRKEYRLLHVLATHAGLVVTHQQLLKDIWGSNQIHNTQYLRILVRKVRNKIESDPSQPRILITESGVGYRLETNPSETKFVRSPVLAEEALST
ncbi:MAG: response regulator [Xanthobacteraceae bacterium]|nr:response regulator [Xanthobacteraceae bacterium]